MRSDPPIRRTRCSRTLPTPTRDSSGCRVSSRSEPVSDWTALTIHETVKALRDGRVTARALVEAYLERITRFNETLGAYLTVAATTARTQADIADERFRRGDPLRPLEGVPLAIKDVLCTRGIRTTCGSRILDNFVPPYDATALVRLARDGAIVLGKTNCDEFAMG